MLTVICGTNRPNANSRIVANRALHHLDSQVDSVRLVDLGELKSDIFDAQCYESKPEWFEKDFQQPLLDSKGVVVVTPEYNGSLPGVLKYFIDMLQFPESFNHMPVAVIGVAAGQFGALRAVEQLELILHYRKAHLFGERLFLPAIHNVLDDKGTVGEHEERLQGLLKGFVSFVQSTS